jgi:triosephosphate isomerase
VVDVSVHPPFTDLRSVQTVLEADEIPIALGAQHCHWEEKGAFTGEVSPAFLAKLNVTYVITGHSERRELFGETDEMVNPRPRPSSSARHDAHPLLRRDARGARGRRHRREGGRPGARRPRRASPPEQVAGLVIAYEPIWAIGTGRTASAEDAQDGVRPGAAHGGRGGRCRGGRAVRIQYGGSVKPSNAVPS